MRENMGLYRGKRKDNGEWIEGSLLKVTISGETYYFIFCDDFALDGFDVKALSRAIVDPETIGEYTGLPDKNGKRIFEGDILQGDNYPFCRCGVHNYFAEVTWFENSPAFGLYTFKNPVSVVAGISTGNCNYMEDFESANWEVIGNIHDNPELLEVSGDD